MKTLIFLVSDLNQEWADHESHQKQTEERTKPTDGNNNVIDKNIQVEPKNLIVNPRTCQIRPPSCRNIKYIVVNNLFDKNKTDNDFDS